MGEPGFARGGHGLLLFCYLPHQADALHTLTVTAERFIHDHGELAVFAPLRFVALELGVNAADSYVNEFAWDDCRFSVEGHFPDAIHSPEGQPTGLLPGACVLSFGDESSDDAHFVMPDMGERFSAERLLKFLQRWERAELKPFRLRQEL